MIEKMDKGNKPIDILSERDWELIKLLILNPRLTNSQISKILGVSKQAISKRRRKLEREGFIRKYIFLSPAVCVDLIKYFRIVTKESSYEVIDEMLKFMSFNWRIILAWLSSENVIEGIVMIKDSESFRNVLCDEFPYIEKIDMKGVKLFKFLNEYIEIMEKSEEIFNKIVREEIEKIIKRRSVYAILLSINREKNIVNLLILREKRFHPYNDVITHSKVIKGVSIRIHYATYELLMQYIRSKYGRLYLKNFQLAYVRSSRNERRIRRLLKYT